MRLSSSLLKVLSPSVLLRLAVAWIACAVTLVLQPYLSADLSSMSLTLVLAALVAVIVVCSFAVVTQAERLAQRLGDPYGTLILTISIAAIEVALISAVMLAPGDHQTIARDSVMAVSMIIMNLVAGLAIIVASRKRSALAANRTGVSVYLSMLIVLCTMAFALSLLIGTNGELSTAQQVVVMLLSILLYGYFLYRQTGSQKSDFQETSDTADLASRGIEIRQVLRTHLVEVVGRTVVLILLMVPIVLLSHTMADLLSEGLGRMNAPVALAGLLIAFIVFLPETITTLHAARAGQMQRVANLCHGALLSTMSLTIPAVLLIALATGKTVILGETPANLVLLGVTLVVTMTSFGSRRITAAHGAIHLSLFVLYALVLFS